MLNEGSHQLRVGLQYRQELLLLLRTGGRILEGRHELCDRLLRLRGHLRLTGLVLLPAGLLLLGIAHHATLHGDRALPYAGHHLRTSDTATHDALCSTIKKEKECYEPYPWGDRALVSELKLRLPSEACSVAVAAAAAASCRGALVACPDRHRSGSACSTGPFASRSGRGRPDHRPVHPSPRPPHSVAAAHWASRPRPTRSHQRHPRSYGRPAWHAPLLAVSLRD